MTTDLITVDYWAQLQHDNLELITSIVPVIGNRIFNRVFHFDSMRDFGIITGSGYIPPITTKRNESNHVLVTYFKDIVDSTAYYNELVSYEDADVVTIELLSTSDEEFQASIRAGVSDKEFQNSIDDIVNKVV